MLLNKNLIDLIETPQNITYKSNSLPFSQQPSDTILYIYNRLLMPLQFSKAFPDDIWKIKTSSIFSCMKFKFDSLTVEKNNNFRDYFAIDSIRKDILHKIIFRHPEWVESLQKELPADFVVKQVTRQKETLKTFQNLFTTDIELPQKVSSGAFVKRINNRGHWIIGNKAAMQFSQNYISKNWQQGGESNLAMNGYLNIKSTYIHPNGWSFYYDLEWRESFFTAPSDTVRSWRVSDDLIRTSSNLAIKAFEKWNYSVSTEFKTRLFNSYQTNSNTKIGSLLSPAEFTFGLGMSYENNFEKLNVKDLSLVLSPFSYNWKYVLNSSQVDVTRFGIDKGKTTLNQIGSRMDLRLNYIIRKNIVLSTRFYYFSTYKTVESEWENTFNFIINRYFSTRIFSLLKYDDKRTLPVGETSYFQFKELLSFGLNYTW